MAPYRFRTRLREQLPWSVAERIPKGRDCGVGKHEWYLRSSNHWDCYHCTQSTEISPWDGPTWAKIRLRAIHADLATLMQSDMSGTDLNEQNTRYADEIEQLNAVLRAEPAKGQSTLARGPADPVRA